MAEGDIWVTDILNDSRLVVGTEMDQETPGWRAFAANQEPAQADLPLKIFAKYKEQNFDDLKEFSEGGGGTKISSHMTDIFRRFNLSIVQLLPAQLYLYDRKTPVDRDIFVMGSWERQEFLVPDESTALRGPVKLGRNPTRRRQRIEAFLLSSKMAISPLPPIA